MLLGTTHVRAQEIRVTETAVNQVPFLGLGIEFDPYLQQVNPERWMTMLRRVRAANTGFLRVMSGAGDYCSGLDAKGNPIYRWQTNPNAPELQRVYQILDFAQANGIEVYLGEWQSPRGLGIKPDDPRWPRMIADFVQYLMKERHYTVIHHYILMNEPNGQWMWPSQTKPDFAQWFKGVQQLRGELDRRGLQSVLLAGPDNSGGREWFQRAVTEMHPLFGAWEQHFYSKDADILQGLLEKTLREDGSFIEEHDPQGKTKPRFVAESGLETGKNEELDQQMRVHDFDYGVLMADYVAQVARAGWLGADAWDLDDAMHKNGKGGQKIWGFWDSSSVEGMKPRPWFESWSLISRALPAGSTVLSVIGDIPAQMRITAARLSGRYSVVIVHEGTATTPLELSLPAQFRQWTLYRYAADGLQANEDGLLKPEGLLAANAGKVNLKLAGPQVIVLTSAVF